MSDSAPSMPSALVVEDDDQIAYLLQFILKKEGYAVAVARDGLEAKKVIADSDAPAFVTLDFMLPHANGLELLALIRAKPGWKDVPVLMLTARSQEKDIAHARASGATDYLVKPFKPEELRACVRRLVGNPAP
ncbi:MAG TPA: response regulator transcription factor [Burkholderiales bacterium]|nr:response regulator transcription factor [Burkholderiales bacterium]